MNDKLKMVSIYTNKPDEVVFYRDGSSRTYPMTEPSRHRVAELMWKRHPKDDLQVLSFGSYMGFSLYWYGFNHPKGEQS